MSKNKVIKPVSFNITKEQDNQMLKHVKRKNFSGYVKKLILADMESKMKAIDENVKEVPQKELKKEVPPPVKESAADRLKNLKEKTKRQQVSKPTPPPFKPKG